MKPYQSKGTGAGGRKRRRKPTCIAIKVKQEQVVKKEPEDSTEMVEVTESSWRQISSNGNGIVKMEVVTDSEMSFDFDSDSEFVKKEIKSEDECPKKGRDLVQGSSSSGDPIDGNISSQQPGSSQNGKNHSRKTKARRPKDGKKVANAKASKKSAVKRQKKHMCRICNYATSYKSHLIAHIRIHTGEKPFVCDVCAKSFTQKSSLNEHKKIHDLRLLFRCSKCPRRFAHEIEKVNHESKCQSRHYECYACHKYTTFNLAQMKHYMRTHSGYKPFKCAVCEMKFSQKFNLKKHLATHAKPHPIRCSKCWKRFADEGTKNAHEGQCNRRLHQCYLCKFNASNSTQLKFHMRTKHTGERPFACNFCEARFALKCETTAHMRRRHVSKN